MDVLTTPLPLWYTYPDKEHHKLMAYQFPPELAELVEKHLTTGEYSSEDEVLLDAMRSLESQRDDWAAIEESLTTLEQGDQGVSLDEAFDTIRKRHNIPQDA